MKPNGNPDKPPNALDKAQLRHVSEITIGHYDRAAEFYWDGTQNHDVSQNYEALLEAIGGDPPYAILDLGCGPGRDLRYFRSLGHDAMGLDGSMKFVTMARRYSGCDVLHQDFIAMNLPVNRFDGIFANASLFHVPSQELPRVLAELAESLKPRGPVLLKSEGKQRRRRQRRLLQLILLSYHLARFCHCCRVHGGTALLPPPGLPRHKQWWLATVLRKG